MALSEKYPGGFTPLLVRRVTGREVPYRSRAADVGVVVLDVGELLEVSRAALTGQPQTHTLVTVHGVADADPSHFRVPLGVAVGDIANHLGLATAGFTVVAGDPLTGLLVQHPQTVLTKRSRLLLFDPPTRPAARTPMGCTRCGLCLEHCPVGLDPRGLLDLVERRRFDAAARLAPLACLECGLCDYLCPSALPLMRAVLRSGEHVLADQTR
jgi:electron transport complex protein RnfC